MLEVILYIAQVISIGVALMVARQLQRAFKKFTPPSAPSKKIKSSQLPSVSVCIPARNEQHALTDCLQRVLSSTYEKLEILVLDDVSGDDTSALIKSFASEGVRFIKGTEPGGGWIGKNHAFQGLLNQASGTYILFLDVDTALSYEAIEHLMKYTIEQEVAMVSVMPRREDGWRFSVIAAPLRYFWELLFSRADRPASASNAWLIRRDVLQGRFNGFYDLKHASQPEAVLAAALARDNDYRFLISTAAFGVSYEKRWPSQLETSVRLLFPLLGGQWPIAVIAALDMVLLLIPYVVLFASIGGRVSPGLLALSAIAASLFTLLYMLYARRMWNRGWFIGGLLWPLLLVQEAVLLLVSAYRHKTGRVTWKGRTL